MVQTIPASRVNIRTLIDNFGLELVRDEHFFPEWQTVLPPVTIPEQQQLDRIINGFNNLLEYPPLLEDIIRMAVVDPLLFLCGFYLPPFYVRYCSATLKRSEYSVEIGDVEEGILIKGSLDAIVLQDQFWVLIVESKQATYSVEAGRAQILSYMLASPQPITYGLVTNGGSFMFIKLVKNSHPQYATSKLFGIFNPDDLLSVFSILRYLGELAKQNNIRI